MKKSFASALIGAVLPLTMLTGCATSGGGKVRPVNLPPPPACMAPVEVPAVEAGADARAVLARDRASLTAANGRLKCSRAWYEGVRREYSKQ